MTALFCTAMARAAGGVCILRIEDLDSPRVLPGAEQRMEEDLDWLHIRFQEEPRRPGTVGPYRQSQRLQSYEGALEQLSRLGLVFDCECSRADIARTASAPHDEDEGPRYPGTCRSLARSERSFRRPTAKRFLAELPGRYLDGAVGEVTQGKVDDFVLRRADGAFSYQLAAAVDDAAMGITQVVRGADLRSSAARQVALLRALGASPPSYVHVPVLTEDDGSKLAKRRNSSTLANLRGRGVDPRVLVRALAAAYGHVLGPSQSPLDELSEVVDPRRFPVGSVAISSVFRRLRQFGVDLPDDRLS